MSLIRGSLLPALIATIVCIIVGGVTSGGKGAVGALLGALIVAGFFASSPAMLGPITKVSPHLSLLVALTFFFTKVIALVALMIVILDRNGIARHLNKSVLGATIIAMTLVWTFSMVRASTKSRQPYFDVKELDLTEDGK